MFTRWFVGVYVTTAIAGFSLTVSMFAGESATMPYRLGFLFISLSFVFVAPGALFGLGLQRVAERLLRPGWVRTAMLAVVVAATGGLLMQFVTGTPPYTVIATCAAAAGAILSQSDRAWRKAWLFVTLSGLTAFGAAAAVAFMPI